jgi:hypothetical protein
MSEQRLRELASLVVMVEKIGTLACWRAYIWDQAKSAGVDAQMARAIEEERKKQNDSCRNSTD